MNYQRQVGAGQWIEIENETATRFIEKGIAFQIQLATMRKKSPPSRQDIEAQLAAGKKLQHGPDWYSNIRQTPAPIKRAAPQLTRCSCGHSVPENHVMSASRGTTCPDCYDRMSDY